MLVLPIPPITSLSLRVLLLPSNKSSLLCCKSAHPNLLLQASSFPAFSHKHTLQSLTPHTMLPTHLLSTKIKLLQPWSSPFIACLTPASSSGPPSAGGSGTRHTSVVSSSSSQSAALSAAFLLTACAPMATSTHRVPSWFQHLAYKILLVADEKNPGTRCIYQKSTWMRLLRKKKSKICSEEKPTNVSWPYQFLKISIVLIHYFFELGVK